MFFFYLDESGTGLGDERNNFFVLAAFAIHSQDWSQLDREVSTLKRRLVSWAKPEDWEIKGRDIRRGEKLFQNQNWPTGVWHFSQTISPRTVRGTLSIDSIPLL